MSKVILDLFCGAGGAAVGYHRAGFDVVGVDIKPQPHYPFEFIQADAMTFPLDGFDAIHASPPCQRFLGVPGALKEAAYPDLLTPTRARFATLDIPWVIENVPTSPLEGFVLCGATFALPVVRHRVFATSRPMLVPSHCPQRSWKRGTIHRGTYPYAHGSWRPDWREHVLPVIWPWMTLEEAGDAIPPAYTEYIGRELIKAVQG